MGLFQLGDFTLNSGAKSSWKLECDALTDDDIAALAAMIRQMVRPFRSVEGVPRGGLRLAEALKPHRSPQGVFLIVDDVLTTGGSMDRFLHAKIDQGVSWPDIFGAVIFARGQCPPWILAVCQLPQELWLSPQTR